jgi:hypothetical protein
VCALAVELDDDAVTGPECVDRQPTPDGVDLRHRDACVLAQRDKASLERAAGLRELRQVAIERGAEACAATVSAPQHGDDVLLIEQPAVIGLRESPS